MSKQKPISPKLAAGRPGRIDRFLVPDLFKALCDPTRARLLACLAKCGRTCSVGEIAECSSVDFSVVSRHLTLLARAGVLEATKQGRTVFYRVRHEHVCAALRGLADAIEECCPGGNSSACDGDGCCSR